MGVSYMSIGGTRGVGMGWATVFECCTPVLCGAGAALAWAFEVIVTAPRLGGAACLELLSISVPSVFVGNTQGVQMRGPLLFRAVGLDSGEL